MEKRKWELEERKKQLDARKRKKTGGGGVTVPVSEAYSTKDGSRMSAVAADLTPGLEPQEAARKETSTIKDRPRTPPNAADAFLAQLEQDMMKR